MIVTNFLYFYFSLIPTLYFTELVSSEIIIEKLLEQRDWYLNRLKHLDFELVMDPTKKEIENIKKLQTNTIDQLKKIEQEIAFLLSEKSQ
jgi:hypothetical protein